MNIIVFILDSNLTTDIFPQGYVSMSGYIKHLMMKEVYLLFEFKSYCSLKRNLSALWFNIITTNQSISQQLGGIISICKSLSIINLVLSAFSTHLLLRNMCKMLQVSRCVL